MILSAFAAMAAASLSTEAKPKITAVSMFKNGFSFIARQTDIPSSGEYVISEPPQAAHGTFWHLPSDGIAITRTASTTEEQASDAQATNVSQLIALNTGKEVTVDFSDLPTAKGTIMKSIGDQLVLNTSEGIIIVSQSRIKRLVFAQPPTMTDKTKNQRRVMKLTVDAKNPGTITTIGLEHGLAWVPAYAVDISEKKELQFVAKATIVNELADLDNVDASFITGFPNIRYAGISDPLTNPDDLDRMLQMLISGSFGYSQPSIISQAAAPLNVVGGRTDARDFTGGFIPQGTGDQIQDLFFYKLNGITLKKGDRAAYTLFTFKAPYEHMFTWQATDNGFYGGSMRQDNQDVWHSIVFKNTSDKPLTTAVASVFSDNEILGQDVLHYTPAGSDMEIQLNKALDIQASNMKQEIARDRAAWQLPGTNTTYDLVTVKGTLIVRNMRKDPAKMRISTGFQGDFIGGDHTPKVTKGAATLAELNPATTLNWEETVGSGDTLKLTYTYKVYVNTP